MMIKSKGFGAIAYSSTTNPGSIYHIIMLVLFITRRISRIRLALAGLLDMANLRFIGDSKPKGANWWRQFTNYRLGLQDSIGVNRRQIGKCFCRKVE